MIEEASENISSTINRIEEIEISEVKKDSKVDLEDYKNELSKTPVILGPVFTKTSQYVEKMSENPMYRPGELKPYDTLLSSFLLETSQRRRCPKCSHYANYV